jgi:hypothetical protein
MGSRFRKRIRLAKGIYWNLSKKGSSLSVGRRGATDSRAPKEESSRRRQPDR